MPEVHSEAARLLGERLRDARLSHELTLEDLGALAEMHWTNIGKIERGQVHPSVETLVRLASAMNLDASGFITGLNADMYPNRTHRLTAAELIRERKRRG